MSFLNSNTSLSAKISLYVKNYMFYFKVDTHFMLVCINRYNVNDRIRTCYKNCKNP